MPYYKESISTKIVEMLLIIDVINIFSLYLIYYVSLLFE